MRCCALLASVASLLLASHASAQDTTGPAPTPPATRHEATPPAPDEKPRVLVLDLEASGVDGQQAKLINGLVTQSMSRFTRFEVISSADVRQLVTVEADKTAAGCDSSSCLAEVAGALGARWVVFGNIGRLGNLTVLTVSLFDTNKAKAVGRQRLEVREIETLPASIDNALAVLMDEPVPPPPVAAKGPSPLFIGGAVAAGAGVIATIGATAWALVLDDSLGKTATSPKDKESALSVGPWAIAGAAVAGVVTAAGAGAAVASMVIE